MSPNPGLLAMMGVTPTDGGGTKYKDAAVALGALFVQDGLDDAVRASAFTMTGTVVESGTDGYGHVACITDSSESLTSASFTAPSTGVTLIGATKLGGGTSDFCRLVAAGAGSTPTAFLGRGAARTSGGTARHTITADSGTWHWFAFTVNNSAAQEVTVVYRDGTEYSAAVTRDDGSTANTIAATTWRIGGDTAASRNIGYFSACAVIPSALSSTQVADLYAAYQRGL